MAQRAEVDDVARARQAHERVRREVSRVYIGPARTTDLMLVALLAHGHVLLEGVPGVAKTTLVKTFATVLGCTVRRIQFTADLLPADITGTIGRPGKRACTAFSIAAITSGRSGEAGLSIAPSAERVIVAPGSAMTLAICWRTLSEDPPGKMRQLTLALAFCGSALVACPPLIIVATQVVRSWPT